MLKAVTFPPGMLQNGTPLKTKGRWRDGNLVRWAEGVMQPVKPWRRITQEPFEGRISSLISVRDSVFRRHLVFGSSSKCRVLFAGEFRDITPSDLTPGRDFTSRGTGYGAANYGEETYGTPRQAATGLSLEATNWSFGVWGTFVVGTNTADGRVFVWRPGTLTEPADEEMLPIDGAPTDNRALLVTEERHLMLLGAGGDPQRVAWSARENYNEWTPSALNLAGDLLFSTSGALQTARLVGNEILVLSTTDAFRMRYVGQPFGYGQKRVGANCGVMGPNAVAVVTDFAVWMGEEGFFVYRGQITPLACDVWDYVYRDLNYLQRSIVCCGHNAAHSEVWWFFPVGDDTFNSRYVIWNYRENWWSLGQMHRSAWMDRGVWDSPVAAGLSGPGVGGNLYEHEQPFGTLGVANRDKPYIVSSPVEVGDGDRLMVVNELIPDQETVSRGALKYTFLARMNPRTPPVEFGPFLPDESGYTPCRITGRELTLRVDTEQDVDWRLGVLRANLLPGSRK